MKTSIKNWNQHKSTPGYGQVAPTAILLIFHVSPWFPTKKSENFELREVLRARGVNAWKHRETLEVLPGAQKHGPLLGFPEVKVQCIFIAHFESCSKPLIYYKSTVTLTLLITFKNYSTWTLRGCALYNNLRLAQANAQPSVIQKRVTWLLGIIHAGVSAVYFQPEKTQWIRNQCYTWTLDSLPLTLSAVSPWAMVWPARLGCLSAKQPGTARQQPPCHQL